MKTATNNDDKRLPTNADAITGILYGRRTDGHR
jgi:hypothetical protein